MKLTDLLLVGGLAYLVLSKTAGGSSTDATISPTTASSLDTGSLTSSPTTTTTPATTYALGKDAPTSIYVSPLRSVADAVLAKYSSYSPTKYIKIGELTAMGVPNYYGQTAVQVSKLEKYLNDMISLDTQKAYKAELATLQPYQDQLYNLQRQAVSVIGSGYSPRETRPGMMSAYDELNAWYKAASSAIYAKYYPK